jgi:quercetin dioxygenase-like cupin family protein
LYNGLRFKDVDLCGMINVNYYKPGNVDSSEILKSTPHIIVEIIEYVDNSVVMKTILKKSTGDVGLMSFDAGEGLAEKISPFDTFVQIIEGKAEIFIDGKSNMLLTGQGIVVPAHRSSSIKPNGRFKMISTVIKSGYE